MTVDKVEGLRALERAGIHVARCSYVDSAENAIAFATRRTADDERFIAISLRAVSASQPEPEDGSLASETAVRRAFARLVAQIPATRILAQIEVERGTDVTVHGCTDERGRKFITLRGRTHGSEQPMPLDAERTRRLVESFMGFGHKPRKATQTMLEHALLDVAAFFERSGIERFTIDPMRLHERSYSVLDATMSAPRPLHVKPRLEPDAHDRKGHYTPSGRQ